MRWRRTSRTITPETIEEFSCGLFSDFSCGQTRKGDFHLPMLERHASDSTLTTREIEIVTLIRRGLRNREIGEVMGISEQDTKNRLRKIFDKLGVWSRLELAMWVVDRGADWPPRQKSGAALNCPAR
jgi:DNA-binding NarL/FixJ family response regulator